MVVILTGPPGAGKGTQAELLVDRLGFGKLSTGDALRRQIAQKTEIGRKAEGIMAAGNLVSDELLLEVLKAEFDKIEKDVILLDGYPRNLAQAQTLDGLGERYKVQAVVHIDVASGELVERLVDRRICSNCGVSYHLKFDPPADGVCRKCGSEVVQRPDDSQEKVINRLKVYEDATKPILDYYEGKGLYRRIDGVGTTEEVYKRISGILS